MIQVVGAELDFDDLSITGAEAGRGRCLQAREELEFILSVHVVDAICLIVGGQECVDYCRAIAIRKRSSGSM